jgi:hypothetical protein
MVKSLYQQLALLPIDEGPGPADGLDALVDLGGELARPLGAGEQHNVLLAQDRIGVSMGDQHLGQRLGAERGQGFGCDGFVRAIESATPGPERRHPFARTARA